MTDITNIILITSMDDGAWANSDHGNADILYEYLRTNYRGESLTKVDHHGGGNKGMTCDIFMAGIDYIDKDKLIEKFNSIQWDRPEKVQLLIKGRKDDVFSVYRPKT
ncbi:MAG: hypothetical protein ABJV04_11865 [Aliiglaciecola sp.]|uniref:hypothetical protein n=1 Tax=Aliiglaciecola sp. TaxID=1872441 RepID=UPI0032986ED2